jgi:selenide, water dikinase
VETTVGLTGLGSGGGCAAKYSAALLSELLSGFAPASSEDLLVGLDPPDDAAVYRLSADQAIVLTTDFFPPMVDDPELFGAIAAANALGDVFAMGGRPLVALSIAAFPEDLPLETVRATLDGAAAKVAEAGAILAGGHTIRDTEAKYGLAVAGTVHPDRIWRKSGARPGDVLVLTKPLGTGLVLTAVRAGALGEEALDRAIESMTALNGRAADALRPFEPTAVTDVTGFGLFGHAFELAARSEVQLTLEADRLPALAGALEAAERDVRTGGDRRNREYVGASIQVDGAPGAIVALGFDAQTSGGLLASVPAARAAVLEAAFHAEGLFVARIGRVEGGSGVRVA